jgi:hypothetical protein
MQTIPFKIEQLIGMARSGQLVVPEFQREFVWRAPQVQKLIDSVARGYPIGSVLLLKRSDRADFASRSIDAMEQPPDPTEDPIRPDKVDDKGVYYILDGQQRITSLVRVFANAHPRGRYCFDVRKVREISNLDGEQDWFIFDRQRHTKPVGDGTVRPRLDKWFLKTQRVFDAKKVSILVDEYFDDQPGLGPHERREARASVAAVFETIRNFEIPAVIMDEKSDLEAICRVFETINSTGTRLTTFDLATAKFYPKPNLRELWSAANAANTEFGRLELDGERVLQVITLWYSRTSERKFEPSRSNLLRLPRDVIERDWAAAVRALRDACAWVAVRGIINRRSLPNEAILVPLAAALSREFQDGAGLEPKQAFHDLIDSWYWRSCMARTFEASTNERIGAEFARLCQLLETGGLEFGTTPLLLSPRILIGIGAQRDSRARVILSFLLSKSARDIKTGEDISRDSEIESHHIFPKSKLAKHPHIDSVVNRVWILRKTNRELGNKSPYEYLSQEIVAAKAHGVATKLEERLDGQCIPIEPIKVFGNDSIEDAFEAFLEERAQVIMDRLVQQIGSKYVEQSTVGDDVRASEDEAGDSL